MGQTLLDLTEGGSSYSVGQKRKGRKSQVNVDAQPTEGGLKTNDVAENGALLIRICQLRLKMNKSASTIYIDLGDCVSVCKHCSAKFLYGERLSQLHTQPTNLLT